MEKTQKFNFFIFIVMLHLKDKLKMYFTTDITKCQTHPFKLFHVLQQNQNTISLNSLTLVINHIPNL